MSEAGEPQYTATQYALLSSLVNLTGKVLGIAPAMLLFVLVRARFRARGFDVR